MKTRTRESNPGVLRLDALNALDDDAAARELRRCCGSARWVSGMVALRPFATVDAVADAADRIWWELDEADWREAFASHPKIGEQDAGQAGQAGNARQVGQGGQADESTDAWSAQEQAGVAGVGADVTRRLAIANRDYEARFGYIFIICATGKSAAEMLAALERRLNNPPEQELRIAAEEQRRITLLRLAKLLDAAIDG